MQKMRKIHEEKEDKNINQIINFSSVMVVIKAIVDFKTVIAGIIDFILCGIKVSTSKR